NVFAGDAGSVVVEDEDAGSVVEVAIVVDVVATPGRVVVVVVVVGPQRRPRISTAAIAAATWVQSPASIAWPEDAAVAGSRRSTPTRSRQACSSASAWSPKSVIGV